MNLNGFTVKFSSYFKSFSENKFASFLLLAASFFIMLSYKVTPMLYPVRDEWIFNPFFDVCEIFPLNFYDCLLWFVLFLILNFVVQFIAKKVSVSNICINCGKKYYLFLTVFFFVAWLPYFFAFYPGTIFFDDVWSMLDPWGYSHQPLLYGYFLKIVWETGVFLGNEFIGFAAFIILKMLFTAFEISYLLMFLAKRGISKKFIFVFAFIFAFFPIFPNYALCTVKDGLFSIFMLFATLFLYEYKNDFTEIARQKKPFFVFLFLSLMLAWLRSNGIYIMLPVVFVVGYFARNVRFRFFVLAIVFMIGAILPNLNRNAPFKETVGMPIQQIARTMNVNGEISDKNKEIFNNILPLSDFKESYFAFGADYVKWNEKFNDEYLNSHKKEFLLAWIETFPKNISTYITAQVLETYEFWAISPWQILRTDEILPNGSWRVYINQTVFPHAITHGLLEGKDIGKTAGYTVISESEILPENIALKIASFMTENVFYINGGICVIILLISMSISLYKGQNERIISALPMFFAWLTLLLASPIFSAFRYVFYFALLMPFILSLPFMNNEEKLEENLS